MCGDTINRSVVAVDVRRQPQPTGSAAGGARVRQALSAPITGHTDISGNASHSSPFHGYWSDTNVLADILAQHCHRDIGCLLVVFCFDFFQYAARKQDPTYWHFCVKIL